MLLSIHNLHAGYRGNEVLRDVSISVDRGEVVALIGPNGAGKSTVLKSAVGLTSILQGKIEWKGEDVTHLNTHELLERGLAFVPQGRLVFPMLTVAENIDMGGYLIHDRQRFDERLQNVLKQFPILSTRFRQTAGSLSGGEQQMLAIGRALMMSPELLMLDEPSLGLSPKVTAELFEKLVELQTSGMALLIVEQNVRLVLRHAQRGYLLSNGQVRFSGSAADLGDEKRMQNAYLV